MKRFFLTFITSCVAVVFLYAQEGIGTVAKKDKNILNHLDLAVTLGTTGIGFDLAAPIGNSVKVRTGFSYMPRFDYDMRFEIFAYDDDKGLLTTKFDKLAGMMQQMSGCEVDDRVDMRGEPTYYNFKLLVDIFPLKDKRWHLTTGFYLGSERIGKAVNFMEEMPSLVAVKMYNNLYDYVKTTDFIETPIYGDVYLDPDVADQLKTKMAENGRAGICVGEKKGTGKPYMMEPDANGMVSAEVLANRFKPYLGVGFGDYLDKKTKKYSFTVDLGVLMWGGTPKIVTHDGVDLAHDVENLTGKVGDYVDMVKAFKVFPVFELRIARKLF